MPTENSNGNTHHDRAGKKSLPARLLLWFLVIPAILCIGALFAFASRKRDQKTLDKQTQTDAPVPVSLIHAQLGASTDELVLPATLQAFDDAPMYARVNGYVRSWSTDIGAHVHRGQLMASIDSPETDQQLLRAEALLSQSKANLTLANTTANRYRELIKDNSVAQQEVDQNNQNARAQSANVQATTADVTQLRQQQQYEQIVAPFDGVVTQRHVNIGDLVNAGNSGTGAELFHVARISTMRIFVAVPEGYSQQIAMNVPVQVTLAELPGKTFAGKVTRTDHSIDQSTRTLKVEIDVPNPTGALMPGAYANVHFKLQAPTQRLLVPSGSILYQAAGPQVGVVDSANHVHLRKLTLGNDLGNSMEVIGGLEPQEALIANPPDFLVEGMTVTTSTRSGKTAQHE